MKNCRLIFYKLADSVLRLLQTKQVRLKLYRSKMGYIADNAVLEYPDKCTCPEKIFIYENCAIMGGARFIISSHTPKGRFVMKKYSGAADGLTVVTGNHERRKGEFYRNNFYSDIEKNIIVEEDVWIGSNVTLLSGVTIGRGTTIAAGAVVSKSMPPYCICGGVPAKVIKFYWSVEEILEHEEKLYPIEERISKEVLLKSREKYSNINKQRNG